MTFTFTINQTMLASSAIFGPKSKNLHTWKNLKDQLWDKYTEAYRYAYKGDFRYIAAEENYIKTLKKISNDIPKVIEETKNSQEFKELLIETKKYKDCLEDEWNNKNNKIIPLLEDILRIKVPKTEFQVLVVHPKIGGGMYLGNSKIFWGHEEEWPNYNMVYLVHEALHEIIDLKNMQHEIIELVADNELRIRLNNEGEYFMESGKEVGHTYLRENEKQLLPLWKEYLSNKTKYKNAYDFSNSLGTLDR